MFGNHSVGLAVELNLNANFEVGDTADNAFSNRDNNAVFVAGSNNFAFRRRNRINNAERAVYQSAVIVNRRSCNNFVSLFVESVVNCIFAFSGEYEREVAFSRHIFAVERDNVAIQRSLQSLPFQR